MPKIKKRQSRSYYVYRRNECVNKKTIKKLHGFSSVGVFICICVMFAGISYLFNTNNTAIKGDDIYDIEQDIVALKRENDQLLIQIAQLRSVQKVENVVHIIGMEEVEEAIYIDQQTIVAFDEKK